MVLTIPNETRTEDVEGLSPTDAARGSVFTRMGRNIGWLLGGRGFAGVVSLAYLAIAARALGRCCSAVPR